MFASRSSWRLLPALLLLALTSLPVAAEDPPIPEWIKSLNPADFILVNQDTAPALPFHIQGSPTAEMSAQGTGITLPDGTQRATRTFLMTARERITGDNLLQTKAKTTTLSWQPYWDVTVYVLETPEVAAAALKDRWGDTYGASDLTEAALGDPRLRGNGISSPGGELVRYRNLIWFVENSGVQEVKPAGGRPLVDSDLYNGAYGDAQILQGKLTPVLAKRWLDKVAGPPVADLRLISLDFDWRGLGPKVKGPPFREARADQQWLSARVQNVSDADNAPVVMLQFYVQNQGEASPQKLGDPIKVADNLAPLGIAGASLIWDLKGKPVENAKITAECYVPDKPDPVPGDNSRSQTVSVWFAQDSAGRPFTWGFDTYSFVNTGFPEQEVEEMVEGALATLLNNVQETPDARKLLEFAMFPPSYQRLKQYLDNSMKAGAGGHCYGMSATAAVYFENPNLKPVAKPVKDMTLAEASTNINLYHRAQLYTLLDALAANWDWQARTFGTAACGGAVKTQLAAGKLCTVVEFFSPSNAPPAGHAVLAYKYVELTGGAPLVYVYDPNYPAPRVAAADAMPLIRLWNQDFRCPDYMNYRTWADGGRIAAKRPGRTISLETVNQVMPGLKKMISDTVAWLKTAGKFMGVLTCPADAVFTDGAGRRVGMVGGKPVNEIPGAEIRTTGEVEIYVLPANRQYSLSVTGTGTGKMSVGLLRAADATTAGVVSFQDLPIQAGTVFQGTVATGGQATALTAAGKTYAPTVAGTYDVSKLPTKAVPGPATPNSPDTGDLVVCSNVVDGKPQGAADSFAQISKLYAVLNFTNLPAQTKAQVSWKRGGQEFSTGEREIGGTGWVWFAVSTDRAGGYEPGPYEVSVTAGARVSRKSFTLGSGDAAALPVGEPELIFSVNSIAAVDNGPTALAQFTLPAPRTISQIRTYHWNHGRGRPPGKIRLRDAAGKIYGPWPAEGADGQGGVKNAYWDAHPNVMLPAGQYTVLDSDLASWAYAEDTGRRGICQVWALK